LNVKHSPIDRICRYPLRTILRGMACPLLVAIGMLVQPLACFAHRESSHHHQGGGQNEGPQTGGVAIFSAGPVVATPNYLLGAGSWGAAQQGYPSLANPSMYGLMGQGPVLPPVGNGFVGNGLVGNGLVGNGFVGNGLANNGFGGNAFVNNGFVNNGFINNGLAGNVPPGNGPEAGNGGFGPQPPTLVRGRVASNDASRARANQFVGFGDEHFRKQKYNDALERYKDASKSAPDLADPYFRQAFAWSAMSKYDQAARAIRRGLSINADWPAADFQLKQLYGDNRLAKATHWELMAKAATADPDNADLLFLLAVELYCDGQQNRSRAFFQRAKTLEPGDTGHIKAFLTHLDAAAPPPQPAKQQL
jgi:hypothetical protein